MAQTSGTTTGLITSDPDSHWLVSGFVGSNFAMNASPSSADFGGSIGYLFKDKVGAELVTGFTPNFQHQSAFFGLGITPQGNNYMGNVIGALPLGADAAWVPYVSGGAGAISLDATLADTDGNAVKLSSSRFGGDIGAGVMGFRGNWGFKADVRYFRTTGAYNSGGATSSSPVTTPTPSPSTTPTPSPGPYAARLPASAAVSPGTDAGSLGNNLLAGLAFWRANIGVAFRW